jgi:ubiquinone/menaquinone biosynthesis C-methylase UbiE
MRAVECVLEQVSRALRVRDSYVELADLALRQTAPSTPLAIAMREELTNLTSGCRLEIMKANAFSRMLAARLQGYFIHPTGVGGAIAGWVMARRSSNRRRNAWVVSLLDVQPHDRVLEIGFGPGVAIQHLAQRASKGLVCGIDSSAVMLRQARRRNATSVREGRVDLRLASIEQLPAFDEPFDKIFSVNAIAFWPRPLEQLEKLRRVLRPGGMIAIAMQPRAPGATDETSRKRGAEIAAQLAAVGFSQIRQETLPLRPAAVCVIGVSAATPH